ncbi:UNVERIFIED_CONTAM: hypothetical protein Slati_1286400 [Sesamum latifolium]|uniref:ARM repeat superfamily protein n=1 Tax=Sesamum latifolium TaxID=2727402 RepID=A0AAW2XH20_9LAMI
MGQEEELQLIGLGPGSGSGPMVSATIGRVMTTLLQAKPKKLQDAISRLQSPPKMAPLTGTIAETLSYQKCQLCFSSCEQFDFSVCLVSLEQSLWFLHKYIGEAAERGEHLDQVLVPIIQHWSRKSRSLHAKGLERVFKWLQEVKQLYGCFQDEAEMQLLKNGALLLSSCWKHYGMLMHLEDHKFSQQYKELLDQYLSGIQFYADNQSEEPNMSKDSKSDTINFFLNCLLLLLGRLDNQQFGNAITEFGSQISQVLMSQLRFADEEVIDGAINIFKAVILRTNHASSKRSVADPRQMDALLATLLDLLDERDAAAKAIVKLVAEYCSIKLSQNPDSGAAAAGKEADGHFSIDGTGCIAALMINRALSKSEFEDVRKLASELCGRIHPKVLVPILSSQLESAANAKDTLKIRVCLFSLCTSLTIRGNNAYRHPDLFRIRKTIQKVLSWTSSDKNEISKAQHGCIDCLALMLCTELQAPESLKGGAISEDSVLAHVINQLTDDEKDVSVESDKIPDTGKKSFVRKILPRVISSVGATVYPEIRAACIQVLFAVAYHLKSSIFPYSNDLLAIALKSLREGSHKEKMAGAKLLACLMASEEDVVESISGGLIEARSLLHHLSSTDPSPDVRQMCQQLLLCLTSH